MTNHTKRHTTKRIAAASAIACACASAALFTSTPASASAAVFFPKGSTARVDRHHVTVSVSASGSVTWSSVDIGGGSASDVGVLVAVKAGGRIEVTARIWIDVIEEATKVSVTSVSPNLCKPLPTGTVSVQGEGGINVDLSGSGESSSGCSGGARGSGEGDVDGGGGCVSNSSAQGGGCGGCDSCEPSEHGHPGCSAFACGPMEPTGSSGSSGTTTQPDGSVSAPRIGPYEAFKVSTADGSALRWISSNGYDPGVSFNEGAAAVEKAGYELYAVRARPPTSSSVVQSLRVITTSASPAVPLRLLRMGTNVGAVSPLTLVVLASTPQKLVDTPLLKIDETRLAYSGSSSNYESLVSALLGDSSGASNDGGGSGAGDAGDAGAADGGGGPAVDAGPISDGATRWVFESSRTVANRLTPRSDSGGSSSTSSSSGSSSSSSDASVQQTLADLFRTRCGERSPVKHAVCTSPDDGGGEPLSDGGGPGDADIADADAGTGNDAGDAGVSSDAGEDGGEDDASSPTSGACPDINRSTCDDIDIAIAPNSTLIATRFRGVIGGDPALVADLVFATTTELLTDGRYALRSDGQPGLCEPIAPAGSSGASASLDEDAQTTCRQTATRTRFWRHLDLGPLVMLLVVLRAVAAIMKRARR